MNLSKDSVVAEMKALADKLKAFGHGAFAGILGHYAKELDAEVQKAETATTEVQQFAGIVEKGLEEADTVVKEVETPAQSPVAVTPKP